MTSDPAALCDLIRARSAGAGRFMVAIAGPPGSGKSTLAHELYGALLAAGESAAVVPMDGFHFDDLVLNARGHRARKGAPFTFDVAGLEVALKRIRAAEAEVAIPIFERSMELSRAAAAIVDAQTRIILVEGNYLLLREPPWDRLRALFDYAIYLDVPLDELERRLIERWLGHGFDLNYAVNWIASNDRPNILEVVNGSGPADVTMRQ